MAAADGESIVSGSPRRNLLPPRQVPSRGPLDVSSRGVDEGGVVLEVVSKRHTGGSPSTAASSDADEVGGDMTFRERVFCTFEHPSSSVTAHVLSLVTMGMIVMSSITLCVETLPDLRKYDHVWYVMDFVFVMYFTAEYVIRFWAAPHRWKFFRNPLNIIDLMSVLPFYVDLLSARHLPLNLRILRLLRVTRTFRVFKVHRFVDAIAVVYVVLKASADVLLLGGFMLAILIVVFSTCVFFAEREISFINDTEQKWYRRIPHENTTEVSPFQSAIHTFWWSIVTVTTVGYGDPSSGYPRSGLGQLFASCCMVSGLLILSLPTSIIASNFLRMYKLRQKHGPEWHKHLEDGAKQPVDTFVHDTALVKARLVVSVIDDLEGLGELLGGYAAWARRMVRDREYLRHTVAMYDACQLATDEMDRRRRFVNNVSELVEEFAWARFPQGRQPRYGGSSHTGTGTATTVLDDLPVPQRSVSSYLPEPASRRGSGARVDTAAQSGNSPPASLDESTTSTEASKLFAAATLRQQTS
eukprot:TRINITY_DN5845_c0_g1_i1.p1 TRINITY_DN5845_c0_g1~~TRINITY_DN5845_c0_g1_i1.p1  ORF type:complete len:550 (+),score=187.50 TRINITY_DN5845_c0_g1_i1:75-1652(+)